MITIDDLDGPYEYDPEADLEELEDFFLGNISNDTYIRRRII